MKAARNARFSLGKQRDASIDDQLRQCERVAKPAGFFDEQFGRVECGENPFGAKLPCIGFA